MGGGCIQPSIPGLVEVYAMQLLGSSSSVRQFDVCGDAMVNIAERECASVSFHVVGVCSFVSLVEVTSSKGSSSSVS